MKLKRKQLAILLIAGAVLYFWWINRQAKNNGIVDDTPSVKPAPFVVETISATGQVISRERVERT